MLAVWACVVCCTCDGVCQATIISSANLPSAIFRAFVRCVSTTDGFVRVFYAHTCTHQSLHAHIINIEQTRTEIVVSNKHTCTHIPNNRQYIEFISFVTRNRDSISRHKYEYNYIHIRVWCGNAVCVYELSATDLTPNGDVQMKPKWTLFLRWNLQPDSKQRCLKSCPYCGRCTVPFFDFSISERLYSFFPLWSCMSRISFFMSVDRAMTERHDSIYHFTFHPLYGKFYIFSLLRLILIARRESVYLTSQSNERKPETTANKMIFLRRLRFDPAIDIG